jgi:hypothetical protein
VTVGLFLSEATMPDDISDIARRLAEQSEAVCRYYLSNGRRSGRYWLVGDVHNTPGRSLYVRLSGSPSGRGMAGRWADAASGDYGDMLDLIAAARGLDGIGAALDEAWRFLGRPSDRATKHARERREGETRRRVAPSAPSPPLPASGRSASRDAFPSRTPLAGVPAGTAEAARRLFQMSTPIAATLAATYLRARGIVVTPDMTALRFHPRCWYRPDTGSTNDARDAWPALIAAVTDDDGTVTGIQRTWLDPSGRAKAPVSVPRRAMGHLLGHAVRFGMVDEVMAAGEGIETVLSLRQIMPTLPLAAALSAACLAATRFPQGLRRLYILRDNDLAGRHADEVLTKRAQAEGIETRTLTPALEDFNDDLRQFGPEALAAAIRMQLVPDDVTRFWRSPAQNRQGHEMTGAGG